MFTKQYQRLTLVAALITALSIFSPALAAGPTGGSPNDALAPTGGTVHLTAGQQQWYIFHTDGVDANNHPSKVDVRLMAAPQGSATFLVWTADQLNQMRFQDPNNPVKPLGQGTVSTFQDNGQTVDRYNGALIWAEDARIGNTYYLQVQTTGMQDSNYTLTVTGDALSFPTQLAQAGPRTLPVTGSAAAPTPTQTQSQTAAQSQSANAANQAGSGPDHAFNTAGQSMTLQPGQQHWYAIQAAGDSSGTAHPTIQARLTANPQGAATFFVWTPQRLHDFNLTVGSNTPTKPVGQGTKITGKDSSGNTFDQFNGDLFWTGDARTGGTFYVVVQNTSQSAVQYTLMLNQQP
jgi:hypothetical protein